MTNSMKQTVIKNPGWWKRRTSMERSLTLVTTIVVLVGLALCIALATVLVSMRRDQTPEVMPATQVALTANRAPDGKSIITAHDDSVCLSPGCIHIASKLLKDMNLKAEPCDDFYEFVCGNFVKNTNIPDDKSSVTSFSVISDQLQEQLRSMIEEEIKPEEPKPFVLAKKLYKACMNKVAVEKRGLEPMRERLVKLGGWPVLEGDKWKDGDFDWKESVYKFRKVGYSVDYFIDFSVGVDYKNSSKRIIELDQAQLGLRREYLIKGVKDKIVKAYYDYMVDVAVIFGAEKSVAEKELMDSLQFEIQLANISLPLEKRRNATQLYNPMTIAEMQIKHPTIPWVEYLNKLLPPTIQVTNEEIIVNNVPSFISSVEKLLQQTPKRILGNYVAWRAVSASVDYLTEQLRKRQLEYASVLSGRTEREARWKECIRLTSESMSLSTGALYVRKYFDEESKQTALEMVQDIRAEFKQILENLDWMDDVTKKSALEKAASMSTHIGYPDELLDNNKLQDFYKDLEINDDSYLDSIINLTMFSTNWSFNRLRVPVNKSEWVTHGRPAVVNAFYSSIENSIQFPAGILQGTFFSSDRPKYMNYGAIGFVIGHEITHGFDDQGRQFDKNGNLVDWWAPPTKESFLKKAQCIIDQYGNYSIPEINMNLNGINTQGENIADNGGIKEAYNAYLKWVERNGKEEQLPGLPYTPQQMFWVSAANTWCSKYRPETLKLRVTTGFHSPGQFRVLGPMSNLEEFSKDFNCPLGSKMNPQNKCKVW